MNTNGYESQPDCADALQSLQQENARLKTEVAEMARQCRSHRRQVAHLEDEIGAGQTARSALQLAELIIDNSPAILFRRLAAEDPKLRKMVYVSPNISRFGYLAEDFISGRMMFRDMVYPEDSERTLREIQTYVARNIDEYTQFYRIVTREGKVRWVEDRTSVVDDPATGARYHQGILTDIHQRKVAEEKLRKSEEKYRRIVETAGEGFLLMDENLTIVDLNHACCLLVGCSRKALIGKNLGDLTAEAYRHLLSAELQDMLRGETRPFEMALIAHDGHSVPVLIHANALRNDTGCILGNMAFVTDLTEHKKALILAGEVQRSLLPRQAPRLNGLDVAGRNISCDEIGGDYFDFLWQANIPDSPFTAVVGDISGHGVDSALLMTTARAFLRMRAAQPGTCAEIVTAMNCHLADDVYATGRFMTLFYLTINPARNRIEWVRAGHDPALLYDPDHDRFDALKGPGLALGVDNEFHFESNCQTGLKKGQIIIVSTDGIWEERNAAGEMFGKHRLQEIIRRNAACSAEAILNTVFREHARFTRNTRTEDDITLVIIKLTG